MKKWIFCLLFVANMAFGQALITKVIPLHYVEPKTINAALHSLLLPNETISYSGSNLIVNVSPKTLTRLRAILHQLDVPPVVFNIAIHQDQADWLTTQNDGDVVYSTHTYADKTNNQSVRIMNGASAFVSIGRNIPLIESVGGDTGPNNWGMNSISYQRKQTGAGMVIVPVLQGRQVKITIHRVNSQQNLTNDQVIDNQQIDTTTFVPLNKWVKLGSAAGSDLTGDSSVVTYQTSGSFTDKATLFIKINIVK